MRWLGFTQNTGQPSPFQPFLHAAESGWKKAREPGKNSWKIDKQTVEENVSGPSVVNNIT